MSDILGALFSGAFLAILGAWCVGLIGWIVAIPCALLCAILTIWLAAHDAPKADETQTGFHQE